MVCSRLALRTTFLLHQPSSATGLHDLKRGSGPQKIALYWYARASVSVFKFLGFLLRGQGMETTDRCQTCALDPPTSKCALVVGLPPEFYDIIGLLVNYKNKSYLSFYLRYIYLSVCGKYIKPIKPIYELLTLYRPTSFSLVRLIVFFYQIRFWILTRRWYRKRKSKARLTNRGVAT